LLPIWSQAELVTSKFGGNTLQFKILHWTYQQLMTEAPVIAIKK
jgi:hypothetical protein